MKALAKEVGAALAFIAIGVAVSLAVVLPQGVEASPDEPRISWVYRGVTPFHGWWCYPWNQFAGWDECWHDNEVGQYTAIDYSRGEQTAGSAIWVDYDGDFELFKMLEYTGNCKGVRAGIYWESYDPANYRGDIHYLHIDVNQWVVNQELDYQVLYIGDVAEQDKPNCPGWIEIEGEWYWPPHLHQSADYSASTPFCTNKFEDPEEGDNWQHKVHWLPSYTNDTDCDRWRDDKEIHIGTDHLDDCTDQAGDDDAWPPDINMDTCANILDVMLFRGPIWGPYDARFDLNADGAVNVLDVNMYKWVINMCCTP